MNSKVLEMKTEVEKLKTGISVKDRKRLAEELTAALADTMLLQIKSQVYHWNVVGPFFKPLHELTEAHYRDLFEAADVIAERIRALGHPTAQSFADLAPKTRLDEETKIRNAHDMVEQLVRDHEIIVRHLRDTAAHADKVEDFVTNDMLTARLDFHEKAIWMLRAIVAD